MIPVKPVKGGFAVNSGDLLQRWTNDHWKSNFHRVVNPPENEASRFRVSMLFFTGPNNDAMISPLPEYCSDVNPPKYQPIRAGDYNQSKIKAEKI